MAGTGPGDLYALCEELLAASAAALDTIPTFDPALAGAPDRTFVSPGQPALDCCDQLAVHAQRVNEQPPGAQDTHKMGARKNVVEFVVTITRCHNVETLPPPTTVLDEVAEQMNADGFALWNHLWNMIRSGDLFTLCGPVIWGGLRALTPQGGCGGWVLSVTAEVEGYEVA